MTLYFVTSAFILSLLIFDLSQASLLEVEKECVPTATVQGPCHDCSCTYEGVFHCQRRTCYPVDLTNVTGHANLPEIRKGDTCVDGEVYRMDCNTCACKDQLLMCTKIACMATPGHKKNTGRQKKDKMMKAVKRENKLSTKLLNVSNEEFLLLPSLPHHAAYCSPSKKYRVDCNVCLCNKKSNLICDKKMCVDKKSTRQIEADKLSGQPCTEPFTKKCVKCTCVDGKTKCVARSPTDCESEDENIMLSKSSSGSPRLTFDYKEQECIPDVVYKEQCNKCYCQKDKTLRCTRKMCLNYAQAVQLEEQRQYLVQHGL